MKWLVMFAATLALAVAAWAEEAKTDSGKAPEAPVLRRLPPLDASKLLARVPAHEEEKDLYDSKNGVFIHIVREKRTDETRSFWSPGEIIEQGLEPGVKWFWESVVLPEKVVLYRLQLTPATLQYLVGNAEAPVYARYLAIREIFRVEGLGEGERLRLIELASRDRDPLIRSTAVQRASEYIPLPRAIPILCRALCDPDLGVSEDARWPVLRFFYPQTYEEKHAEFSTGRPEGAAIAAHERVLDTARKVHQIRPDLVTDEDLATINSLRESQIADSMKPSEKKPESPSEAKPEHASPNVQPEGLKRNSPGQRPG